jgi:phage terminase large subunit-like protein
MDTVENYARAVVVGEIVTGRLVRLACERHLRDLVVGPERGLRWDWPAAERIITFFSDCLRLAEGEFAGRPFVLQPWQAFIVGSLFGWKGLDGSRRYNTCYAEIGKGSGKSPSAAGIGLYCLTSDGEAGAQVYAAATTRDQAKIVWNDAERMVQASPALRDRITETVNNLSYHKTGSFFRPVSADQSKLDGLRPSCVIIDELHEHPSSLVLEKMRAGFKGRRQPLMIEITNSGFDKHSICWQHHEYSAKVLEGTIENDSWFAFVCGLDEGDDWRDESVWLKANPNLGVSVTLKYLREQVGEAVEMPPKQNIVRRLNFCEWTEQSVRAIDMDHWAAGGPPVGSPYQQIADELGELEESLVGRTCVGGLDLAKVSDLSAFVMLFPPGDDDELWRVLCRFWVPEDDITQRSRRDRVPYDAWRDHGFLQATPGNVTDYAFIQAQIIADAARFSIREIAFDRTFAGEIVQGLMNEGLAMVQFGQGFMSMSAPTAELLRLVKARQLYHGGHPVLRWCASNLAVQTDPAGNMKPDKARSTERIDGVVALCNAMGRALMPEEGIITGNPIWYLDFGR